MSPSYFSTLDLPDPRGARLRRRDTRDGRASLHRERSLRATFRGRSPIGQRVALRPIRRPQAKPVVREIVGVARQVKGRPDEPRTSCRSTCRSRRISSDDIFLVVRPKSGRGRGAGAVGPCRHLASGPGAAGQRAEHPDARGHRVGGDRPPSLPRRDGDGLCGAGAASWRWSASSASWRIRSSSTCAISACAGRSARRRTTCSGSCSSTPCASSAPAPRSVSCWPRFSGRLIETMLFGVRPLDPTTFAIVTIVLGVTAALSIVGPAWRAARIDPAAALRKRKAEAGSHAETRRQPRAALLLVRDRRAGRARQVDDFRAAEADRCAPARRNRRP